MLLVIDVGNTETALGLYFEGGPDSHWRVATRHEETADEKAYQITNLLGLAGHELADVTGVCLASVVPTATTVIIRMCFDYMNLEPLIVNSSLKIGLEINCEQPENVGGDRIANAVAGYAGYGGPLIIVDFGTATTFDVISDSGSYLGGAIAPGLTTGAQALFKNAAMLSGVVLEAPQKVIGINTETGLKSGLIYGTSSMVDGMIAKMRVELKSDAGAVATGGLADLVAPHCLLIDEVEPFLTLKGLKRIWELNSRISP